MSFGLQRFPDRQVGSNAEPLSVQLVRYGVPIDFTSAAVHFTAVNALNDDVMMDGAGVGASNGVVQYQPTLADVAIAGEFRCQFVATFADQTVHRSEMIYLRVLSNA
jgi:hypothetical protein